MFGGVAINQIVIWALTRSERVILGPVDACFLLGRAGGGGTDAGPFRRVPGRNPLGGQIRQECRWDARNLGRAIGTILLPQGVSD